MRARDFFAGFFRSHRETAAAGSAPAMKSANRYRSKQTGRFPSPIGRAHLSSEMEGTQVGRKTPWNTMEHAEIPSATRVVKGGKRGSRSR